MFYPIGSFYWSSQSTNPTTLFGGIWTQIKDAFVYAGSEFNDTIQGEATHTLTMNEMPKHAHKFKSYNANVTASGDAPALINRDGYRWTKNWDLSTTCLDANGDNAAHNNMPPYITAYCWYRTS